MKILSGVASVILMFCLTGCLKEDLPVIENITKGGKWNLHIGDSFEDIYKDLQELGIEKGFSSVSLTYRPAFNNPSEIRESLHFYHILTVTSSTGREDRVVINLKDGRVASLLAGGALPGEVNQWPQRAMEGSFIVKGMTIEELYRALEAIHDTPDYREYQIVLSDKPLDLSFDPAMKNHEEWAFSFFQDKEDPGKQGRSQVRLHFKNGKLDRIHHVYEEFDVVY